MSKHKVGDKVVMEITGVSKYGECYEVAHTSMWNTIRTERVTEPLSTYTEPLEAKIRRQAAEITRLLAENERLKPNYENIRAVGQNEAWELAKKILEGVPNGGYSPKELAQIFGCEISKPCIVENTYSEAAAKVAEWEKAKEEIKVGDIVKIHEGYDEGLCVLGMSTDKKYYNAVDGYGAVYYMLTKEMITKTGRHIDIDSFLKQIGEEE